MPNPSPHSTAPPSSLPGSLVSCEWLQTALDNETPYGIRVVDVRWYIDHRSGRDAYDAGHLPGAVFMDLDTQLSAPPGPPGGRHPLPPPEVFAAAMTAAGIFNSGTEDPTPVVAYDDMSGAIAARLWWMLSSMGHPVAVLDGGIHHWQGPLSTEPPQVHDPAGRSFGAPPWPTHRLANADEVAAAIVGPTPPPLIDARSPERYRGEDNPIDPRFGHIPGAQSAPWQANTTDGLMAPPDALQKRFAALGITAQNHTDAIAYCGSGVTACHNLLALDQLGLSPRLYVGSWSEWGADPSRPLSTDTP